MSLFNNDDSSDDFDFNEYNEVDNEFICCDNMILNSDINAYKCPVCSKIIPLNGSYLLTSDIVDRNIKISKSNNAPYLELPKLTNQDKIYKTLSEINGKLVHKIPDEYFYEIINNVESIKQVIKNRGDIDDSIFINSIHAVAAKYSLATSLSELQTALNISNKKICSGFKRIQNTIISGHSIKDIDQLQELNNILISMMELLGFPMSFKELLDEYIKLYIKYNKKARDPKSLCAGAIWTLNKRKGLNITEAQMKVINVSPTTFVTIYNEINQIREGPSPPLQTHPFLSSQ